MEKKSSEDSSYSRQRQPSDAMVKPETESNEPKESQKDDHLAKVISTNDRGFMSRMLSPKKPVVSHPLGNQQTGPEYLVQFDGDDDPWRPVNWPKSRKVFTMAIYALAGAGAAMNSAIFASNTEAIAEIYHVGTITATLGTSLTLVGFAVGPLFWGPLSEVYGRKNVILGPLFIAACFAFGCGASENIQTIMICRFFQGVFSSSAISNAGGALADMFTVKKRGAALILYSLCVVGGPLVSPVIGAAITTSYLGWRWTMYIVGILQTFTSVLGLLIIEESYAPVVLARKAAQLRAETGNWALHAKHEEWTPSLQTFATKYLVRPFRLLLNPICLLMCSYASFVYGLIYGSLSAVPIIFRARGWGAVTSSLPFLALLLGTIAGLLLSYPLVKRYGKAVDANGGKAVPEARLYPMMFGCFAMTAGLFILAWTGELHVVWVVPCIGIFLIGLGFFPLFQSSLNYVVDAFLPIAASALAALTVTRSLLAAAFPLFIEPLLDNLGIAWGVSLLGFVSVALLPIPFVFFIFGKRIRERYEKDYE